MNKLYLIKKNEIDLITNRDNFNIILKYLKSKYPLKREELIEIENIGVKKYREAYQDILELVNIEQNINHLDSDFNDYHNSISKLIFAIIILLLVSIFFLNTLFKFFTIMNLSFLWKVVSIILVGGINLYLAIEKYDDIRYKNKSFNKYKNTRNILINEFKKKYEKVLENIAWFELQSDYLVRKVQTDINNYQTKSENMTEREEVLPNELTESNTKSFVKTYKKR